MKMKKKVGPEKKAAKKKRRVVGKATSPSPRDKNAEMLALIGLKQASLRRQDERDWETNKKYENEPMIGEPEWHPHRPH